jgi:hypothetical protein
MASQLPAFAAAVPHTISIGAKSLLPRVTGDVWVMYQNGAHANAKISGAVTGTTSGEVLRLYAQQFPYKKKPGPLGQPVTMPTGTSTPYSFKVTPTLATRYKVELFADSHAPNPLASSATTTVYVTSTARDSGVRTCNRAGSRPVCHQTIRQRVIVPASTLRTEISKRWFVYFGLNLSRTGIPPQPKSLRLGAGHAHVSKARRISAGQYAVNITFSFRIGNEGYFWLFNACQKDTEAKDGLNLPGHHGCGVLKVISSKRVYLG